GVGGVHAVNGTDAAVKISASGQPVFIVAQIHFGEGAIRYEPRVLLKSGQKSRDGHDVGVAGKERVNRDVSIFLAPERSGAGKRSVEAAFDPRGESMSEQPVVAAPFGCEVGFEGGGSERADIEEIVARAACIIEPDFAARLVVPNARPDFSGSVETGRAHRPRIEFKAFEFTPFGRSKLEAEAESCAHRQSAEQTVDVVSNLDGGELNSLRRDAAARERPARELRHLRLGARRRGRAGGRGGGGGGGGVGMGGAEGG